jgi:DNA polymerase-3 subunit gamma/tau
VEIRVSHEAPSDFRKRLEECLSEWTGTEWSIILSTEDGQQTLQAEADNEQARIKSEASNHPVVKAVLDHFPGAEIKEVRERQ